MGDSKDPADEARFTALFTAHAPSLLGYALRRTSPADAADLVAETMLVAWRRLAEVPAGSAERLWLYGVARGMLANGRRASLRRDRLGARFAVEVGQRVEHHESTVVDQLAIGEAVRHLSRSEREVVLLTAWEGLSPAEIALVLDVPAATVRSRLHRARQELRGRLDREARATPPGTLTATNLQSKEDR